MKLIQIDKNNDLREHIKNMREKYKKKSLKKDFTN